MASLSIVVVYHPNCKASTDFLILVSKLTDAEIEYINIKAVSYTHLTLPTTEAV